jgi:hypothetical protein
MGAKAARATGVGTQALKAAAGGAAAGVGYGNPETLKEGAVDAGIGAAAGAAIPVGAGLLKGGVKWLEGMTNPGGAIRREARGLLAHTPDAEQILARQERLAPGTATVADISPEMTGLMSGVGADRATGSAARVAAEEGVEGLMQGIRNVQAQYEQVTNGVMLKATDKVLDVMEKYSKGRGRAVLAPNGEVHAKDVQMLRSQIRDKLRNTKKGWVKDKLRPDEAVLDKYLQSRLPAISKLDSDYKFLLGRIKAKEDLASTVTKSGAAHAKIRGYGKEPGSVGGSLLGSKLDKILGLLSPNQADRARAAQEYLMTSRLPRRGMPPMPHIPGGAFGVGSWGGQVGGGLLGEE